MLHVPVSRMRRPLAMQLAPILDVAKDFQWLTKLDLKYNNIGDDGAQVITDFVKVP